MLREEHWRVRQEITLLVMTRVQDSAELNSSMISPITLSQRLWRLQSTRLATLLAGQKPSANSPRHSRSPTSGTTTVRAPIGA